MYYIPKLPICIEDDQQLNIKDIRYTLEELYDDTQAERNCYPPNTRYMFSYKCMQDHMAAFWSPDENQPETEKSNFHKLDEELQRIVLSAIGCILRGDSEVLDTFSKYTIGQIKVPEIAFFFRDQEHRESIHQIAYSKMLDITDDADYYRSKEFSDIYMHHFQDLVKDDTIKELMKDLGYNLYFIMLCENIMFSVFFLVLMYLGYSSVNFKICETNKQVMKDEYKHYIHARGLLNLLNEKISKVNALMLLDRFVDIGYTIINDLMQDYVSQDGLFSKQTVTDHFNYIVHQFKTENMLYNSDVEYNNAKNLYDNTPCFFVKQLQCETKNVFMEVNVGEYSQKGNFTEVDLNDWEYAVLSNDED